jgi:hypothetical protein
MSWVTIIWAMIASACLTLALVHLLVWWRRHEARANLLFALTAAATAVFAGCELGSRALCRPRLDDIKQRMAIAWARRHWLELIAMGRTRACALEVVLSSGRGSRCSRILIRIHTQCILDMSFIILAFMKTNQLLCAAVPHATGAGF